MSKSVKKKVLILNYGLHISGVSRALVNFANELVNHNYDVTIKIETNDFTLCKELDPRVKFSLFLKEPYLFGIRIPGFLRIYPRLLCGLFKKSPEKQYKKIVKKEYDVEIAFNRGACARIIAASTNINSKKLVWVHSDYMKNYNSLAGFNCLEDAILGYNKFDKIVCVSKQAKDSFIKKFGISDNVIVRSNIFDIDRIESLAKDEVIVHRNFTICAVGRLVEAKNYYLLLDSINVLKQRKLFPDVWIIGDGDLYSQLMSYKNTLELDNVFIMGAKENPYPYMKAADLYVSSSIYEGLSTTLIEAMILGKPCVVTNCCGMEEITGDGKFGVMVPIDNVSLANEIEKMMIDDSFRKYYTEQAIEGSKRFSSEKCFTLIENLF